MTYLVEKNPHRRSKRVQYNRTVAALANLSLDTALDLNTFRGDAAKIACKTVYGV